MAATSSNGVPSVSIEARHSCTPARREAGERRQCPGGDGFAFHRGDPRSPRQDLRRRPCAQSRRELRAIVDIGEMAREPPVGRDDGRAGERPP
jgi:hypothetical protein